MRLVAFALVTAFAVACAGIPQGLPLEESPTSMADGTPAQEPPSDIAEAVAPFVDGPVIATKAVAIHEVDLPSCSAGIAWEGEPLASAVVVAPESFWWYFEGAGRADPMVTRSRLNRGARTANVSPSTGPVRELRAVCEARPGGDLWSEAATYADEFAIPAVGGMSSGSMDYFETETSMLVPGDVAWMVYDRGSHWLAVDVEELKLVPVRWWGAADDTTTSTTTRAVFVRSDGTTVGGWVSFPEGLLPDEASD